MLVVSQVKIKKNLRSFNFAVSWLARVTERLTILSRKSLSNKAAVEHWSCADIKKETLPENDGSKVPPAGLGFNYLLQGFATKEIPIELSAMNQKQSRRAQCGTSEQQRRGTGVLQGCRSRGGGHICARLVNPFSTRGQIIIPTTLLDSCPPPGFQTFLRPCKKRERGTQGFAARQWPITRPSAWLPELLPLIVAIVHAKLQIILLHFKWFQITILSMRVVVSVSSGFLAGSVSF